MPMDARDIEQMIKAAIPDAEVTIRDLAGDGDHYAATVISESFRGKSRVQQHQIVYQSLRGQMGGVLHALALQTGTPFVASTLRSARGHSSRQSSCASRRFFAPKTSVGLPSISSVNIRGNKVTVIISSSSLAPRLHRVPAGRPR